MVEEPGNDGEESRDVTFYFLSDVHLANGDPNHENTTDPEQLHRFLHYIRDAPDTKCVIAGDAFELWQSNFKEIYSAHRDLVEDLLELVEQEKIVYTIGNHDGEIATDMLLYYDGPADIQKIAGLLKDEYHDGYGFESLGARQIEVVHGDIWDKWNHGPFEWIGRGIAYLGGLVEKAGWYDVEKYFGKVQRFLKKWGNKPTPGGSEYVGDYQEYIDGALDWIHRYGEDVVVYGHTHNPRILHYDAKGEKLLEEIKDYNVPIDVSKDKWIANTGSQVNGATDVVVLRNNVLTLQKLEDVLPEGYREAEDAPSPDY